MWRLKVCSDYAYASCSHRCKPTVAPLLCCMPQIPVLESLLDKCDSILLGGGMIFTFYRALGMSTGASMVEEDFIDMARDLIKKAEAKGVKLLLPKDVVVADKFAADAATQQVNTHSDGCFWSAF